MRRLILGAVIAMAVGLLAIPSSAAGQTQPKLTLAETCTQAPDGTRIYGINVTVTGVAPFSQITGSIQGNLSGVSGTIFADANGVASIGVGFGPALYTVEITSPFSAVQTLQVDCIPNSKEDCKAGGWRGFFGVFKNQGDCVSFVATKGKNPPANSP
jgi:hypothetical protein